MLEGVSEWRVVAGTRSGQLLAESLCRAFFEECPRLDGSVAGGRLIFTNLSTPEAFPQGKSSTAFQYVLVRDPNVLFPVGAALNANFPPVFSNAPVDSDRTDRYWVTDGGATDNRGLLSLL